jgi:hypothetical protein
MSAFIPKAINQFNNSNGQPWPPTTWPDGEKHTYTGNCGPTSAAWLLAYANRSQVPIKTPPEIRELSGIHDEPMAFDSLARVVEKLIGDRARMRKGLSLSRLRELLDTDGIALGLPTDYEFFHGDSTFLPDFKSGHFLVAIGGTIRPDPTPVPNAPGPQRVVDVMDPIGERNANGVRQGAIHPVRLPQLMHACEEYGKQHGAPPGTVWAIVVRQPKAPGEDQVAPGDTVESLRARVARLRDDLDAVTDERDGLKAQLDQIAALAGSGA